MKFVPSSSTLRLVSIRPITSKSGKPLTFVKVADTATFDVCEFLVSRDCDVSALMPGMDYSVEIDIDGKYTTINFLA